MQLIKSIPWLKLLKSWAAIALGVLIATRNSDGIQYSSFSSLSLAVLLISLFNLILLPALVLLALPFIVLTLGLGVFVLNAFLFLFVSWLVPGFNVASFSSALWAAIIVGAVSFLANALFGSSTLGMRFNRRPQSPRSTTNRRSVVNKEDDDDVIDI